MYYRIIENSLFHNTKVLTVLLNQVVKKIDQEGSVKLTAKFCGYFKYSHFSREKILGFVRIPKESLTKESLRATALKI